MTVGDGMVRIVDNEAARSLLAERYLRKNEEGTIQESSDEMLWRVASSISLAEDKDREMWTQKFFDLFKYFLPNAPTMYNAGMNGTLSACFVIPVEDSLDGIFRAVQNAAKIFRHGGGVGYSFSKLRPQGAPVRVGKRGYASGPVSFMMVFDTTTEVVKQGGLRRGANIGTLSVNHPDILDFIRCKNDGGFQNFNLSVAWTQSFIDALHSDVEYPLIDPHTNEESGTLRARDVLKEIAKSTWTHGCPGALYLPRINEDNPVHGLGTIQACNPCGEVPMYPNESCNLGSHNITKFLVSDNGGYKMDWDLLRDTTSTAVRFLDNVIEVNEYPLQEIDSMTKDNRKIGLGIMGFADALVDLGIVYGSPDCMTFIYELMGRLRQYSKRASARLAEEKGNFPNWGKSIFKDKNQKRRNAALLSIAPTGELHILHGCSASIEPFFGWAVERRTSFDTVMRHVNERLLKAIEKHGLTEKDVVEEPEKVPEGIARMFPISTDIDYDTHLKVQASFQQHVDLAISKTINAAEETTVEQIEDIYMRAQEYGCKGLTVLRKNARSDAIITDMKKHQHIIPRNRKNPTTGITHKVNAGASNIYVTVNWDQTGPIEVFTTSGKHGYEAGAKNEAISRLISLALRCNVDPNAIIKQLNGLGGDQPGFDSEFGQVKSIPDALAKVMQKYLNGGEKTSPVYDPDAICPECSNRMIMLGGCLKCENCSFKRC
jgi:ribonucleoside-diphosphate reductase alpha chain